MYVWNRAKNTKRRKARFIPLIVPGVEAELEAHLVLFNMITVTMFPGQQRRTLLFQRNVYSRYVKC